MTVSQKLEKIAKKHKLTSSQIRAMRGEKKPDKCSSCKKSVADYMIFSLPYCYDCGKLVYPQKCTKCRKSLLGRSIKIKDGKSYCYGCL